MNLKFSKTSDKSPAELSFLTGLDHPNLVRILSVEETADGKSIITMEDVDGVGLDRFVAEHGKLSVRDTLFIAKSLCAGISYLHGLTPPWLYCDMKPENVMVTGSPKAIDAVVIVDIDGGCPMVLDGLAPKESYGTRGYAAPEQIDPTGPLDFRVDVYGICATLDAVYKRPKLIKSAADKRLSGVIQKGMCTDPKDRFYTVAELKKAFG